MIIEEGQVYAEEYSITEAKNKLPSIVHDVEEGTAVKFLRRGQPVAVLMSMNDYERLSSGRTEFWTILQEFRANVFRNGDIVITDDDFKGLRDTAVGREMD